MVSVPLFSDPSNQPPHPRFSHLLETDRTRFSFVPDVTEGIWAHDPYIGLPCVPNPESRDLWKSEDDSTPCGGLCIPTHSTSAQH